MVGPLSTAPDVDGPDGDPLVVGVDDERADEVLSALSATTTRRVLAALHDDPAPPSALANRLDTSIQNVQYHLGKLEDAGLVEAADTAYSEKGREMTVYRPADRALVFVAGPGDETAQQGLLTTLKRLLGGVGVLGLASLAVDRLLGPTARPAAAPDAGYQTTTADGAADQSTTGVEDGAGGGTGNAGTTEGAADTAVETDAAESTVTEAAEATEAEATGTPAATGDDGASTGTEAVRDTVTDAATTPSEGMGEATRTATEAVATTVDPGAVDVLAASPGSLFFLGGLTALLLLWVLYRR